MTPPAKKAAEAKAVEVTAAPAPAAIEAGTDSPSETSVASPTPTVKTPEPNASVAETSAPTETAAPAEPVKSPAPPAAAVADSVPRRTLRSRSRPSNRKHRTRRRLKSRGVNRAPRHQESRVKPVEPARTEVVKTEVAPPQPKTPVAATKTPVAVTNPPIAAAKTPSSRPSSDSSRNDKVAIAPPAAQGAVTKAPVPAPAPAAAPLKSQVAVRKPEFFAPETPAAQPAVQPRSVAPPQATAQRQPAPQPQVAAQEASIRQVKPPVMPMPTPARAERDYSSYSAGGGMAPDSIALEAAGSDSSAAIEMAGQHVTYGVSLAQRGAVYLARAEFVAALKMIAQTRNIEQNTRQYSKAVTAGLTAIKEAGDFMRLTTGPRNIEMAAIISGHKTTVLNGVSVSDMPPAVAAQALLHVCRGATRLGGLAGNERLDGAVWPGQVGVAIGAHQGEAIGKRGPGDHAVPHGTRRRSEELLRRQRAGRGAREQRTTGRGAQNCCCKASRWRRNLRPGRTWPPFTPDWAKRNWPSKRSSKQPLCKSRDKALGTRPAFNGLIPRRSPV